MPLPPSERKHTYYHCDICFTRFTPDLPSPMQPGGGMAAENWLGESRTYCWTHAKKYLEAF